MLPNFLIAGPPKCASTSLHFYLNQHPDIFMSPVKETNFFTRDFDKGLEFYASYFEMAKNEKVIGEATPSYSFLPFTAQRIQETFPDMKFLFCFRNPAERAFSNWLMLWDAGVEIDDFKTALNINLNQLEQVSFEGEEGAGIWNDRVNHLKQGEKWVRMYIQAGMYAKMLRMYMNLFPVQNIKFIFLDDLKKDFDNTMKSIFSFLEVDENFVIPVKEDKNYYYNRKIYRNLNKLIGIKATRSIARMMPNDFKNIFKEKKQKVKKELFLEDDDRKWLNDIYRNDIQQLEKLTGRNLGHWL
ncbi:MAG: sulfotransferase [Bacteroidota bacterium]